jgi:hypothetical protein
VQVKSTTFKRKGSWTVNLIGAGRTRYGAGLVDFFAVYIVPIDLWYILPFEVVKENLSLNLTPSAGHKFAQYREAWGLMTGSGKSKSKAAELRS